MFAVSLGTKNYSKFYKSYFQSLVIVLTIIDPELDFEGIRIAFPN